MAQTLEDLRGQVESTEDLASITRAMKALAAVRIRQSREAVDSLRAYASAVERGFQILVTRERVPSGGEGGAPLAVVLGSDLGMVGRFNRKVANQAEERLEEEGAGEGKRPLVLTVGERVASEMAGRGWEMESRFGMPDTLEGMTPRVQDLLVALEELRAREDPSRILLVYNEYRSGADYAPTALQVLPLDEGWVAELGRRSWPGRVLPGFNIPSGELFSRLLREHLFLSLFRAMAESHASENASRLASMEAAEKRIRERLEDLKGRLNQQRKQQMTEELLDIMAGAAALEDEEEDEEEGEEADPDQGRAPRGEARTGGGP